MIPLPKPRGFWDYALFVLLLTCLLMFLFWIDASEAVGWADAAVAFVASAVIALAIIVARKREKATWMRRPRWHTYLAIVLGACSAMVASTSIDSYLLHRGDLTYGRLWHDVLFSLGPASVGLWSARRQSQKRQPL
jgi:hypothetical protein